MARNDILKSALPKEIRDLSFRLKISVLKSLFVLFLLLSMSETQLRRLQKLAVKFLFPKLSL